MKETTTLRSSQQVRNALIDEIHRRGGVVHVGSAQKPGADRNIYDDVADRFDVTPEERELSIGDICPQIHFSGRKDAEKDAKRNAWEYTMLVGCQKARYEGLIYYSRQRGVWELTEAGMRFAASLRLAA